jgi:ferredoxin
MVDRKACLKSGQCTYLHPELFVEGPDGYPEVLVDEVPAESREAAEDAVDVCPASAIRLEKT